MSSSRKFAPAREPLNIILDCKEQELYVLAQSHARILKERAMRRRKLKWLWARLKQKARAAWRLIDIEVAEKDATFTFALNRDKLRKTRHREGRYLLTRLKGPGFLGADRQVAGPRWLRALLRDL